MTIDLQIAIIEKIKKIKQQKNENVLTYHITLLFRRSFLFKFTKKKKRKTPLKDAALEVSNICSRLLIVLLPQSWFPMRLNFFPFSFILFVLPSFFFFSPLLLQTLKSLQLSKAAQIILPPCSALMLWPLTLEGPLLLHQN